MMTKSPMNRREFFENLGKGSLVVGFSLSPVAASLLAEEAHAASVDSSLTVLSAINPTPNDAWLKIDHQGNITLLSGKMELGTGTQTAFMQIVAEELYVDVSAITYVQGDTSQTNDQGFTAGSKSIQVQGPLVRRAAATAFKKLLDLATTYLGTSDLVAKNGSFGVGPAMKHPTSYAKLIAGQTLSLSDDPAATIKDPSTYTVVGQPVPRVDLLDKFTGRFSFVSDVVVSGMLHGRVMRSNFHVTNQTTGAGVYVSKPKNANNVKVDPMSLAAAQAIPGFVQVVQQGNFVGVVATTEWGAIQAAKTLQLTWDANPTPLVSNSANLQNGSPPNSVPNLVKLTDPSNIYNTDTEEFVNGTFVTGGPTRTYYSPYQMHGSVGPSCAVANVTADAVTVWSGTQGVYPLQLALSDILGLPQSAIRIIYVEGPGCYGHNGADDAAADAALMSKLAGAPVRVQWMRQDEHGWEPLGPAMAHTLTGGLDQSGNNIASWSHEVWTPPHNSRPAGTEPTTSPGGPNPGTSGGNLIAGQEIGLTPAALPWAPTNNGTRNGPVNYNFPAMKLTAHHVRPAQTGGSITIPPATKPSTIAVAQPVVNTLPRSSALRSLGGMSNCFANESFMDELALAANQDPVAFREKSVCALNNGKPVTTGVDSRAVAALEAMKQQANWGQSLAPATKGDVVGKGVSFARYETVETYLAVYAEVEVATSSKPAPGLQKGAVWVRRVVVAHDCGLVINPDGLKNQIEGNVIQGISRTLIEEVQFDTNGVTSLSWGNPFFPAAPGSVYPVVHFNQVPASIEIVLLNQLGQGQFKQDAGNVPGWGAGEPTIGPVSAAIGNAIFNAIGQNNPNKRLTVLPITPARVQAVL